MVYTTESDFVENIHYSFLGEIICRFCYLSSVGLTLFWKTVRMQLFKIKTVNLATSSWVDNAVIFAETFFVESTTVSTVITFERSYTSISSIES